MNESINCRGCAKEIHYTAKACPNCGATNPLSGQGKNKIAAGLLALFLGCWGIHKFYLGKPGMGILYILCTFPGALLLGIPTLLYGSFHLLKALRTCVQVMRLSALNMTSLLNSIHKI